MAARYVALLRGINVGKAKRIAMADLRDLLEGLGHTEVRTLLNSGNAVFTVARAGGRDLGATIEHAIREGLGVSSRVTILSAAELAEIIAGNPLLKVADNPSRLLICVLTDPSTRSRLVPLTRETWHPEAFGLGKRASYLWCPRGIIESRVAKAVDKAMGDGVTARNLTTMLKLHALVGNTG
jgi:uncharacterized protein (DUF1697 family)